MLRVRNLTVQKGGKTICSVADLEVSRGERVGVIGPNGCGKTTLLRAIGGLEHGFNGDCQADVPVRDRVFVHQSPFLFRGSVLFNATYGLRSRKMSRKTQVSTARHWLETLAVKHLETRSCENLSGGERRRVALARAFAIRPDLLLLDEPLADLDSEGMELVCQAIRERSDCTILISSPVPLPAALTDRSIRMSQPA